MTAAAGNRKLIDNLIYGGLILFAGTLTNALFFNQLGYYSALLLMLYKYATTKENPFRKTGLELPMILFIIAEIISTALSVNQPQAFEHMLKRVLLLPTIYTVAFGLTDLKRLKVIFKVYIFFAVASAGVYIFYSYEFFIKGWLQLYQTGPSVYQFPITTSELLSFTLIYLFAFFINEKQGWKVRLLTLFSILLSLMAILATFKRTGWIGLAAGIVLVIALTRKWWYLVPIAAFGLLAVFLQKEVSMVKVLSLMGDTPEVVRTVETGGSAYSVTPGNGEYFLADYEEGVKVFRGDSLVQQMPTPEPVYDVILWNGRPAARLIDTRIALYEATGEGYTPTDEFTTPGFVHDFAVLDTLLYVLDLDSGLTVFDNPGNLNSRKRYPELRGFRNIYLDSLSMTLIAHETYAVHRIENGLPGKELLNGEEHPKLRYIASTGTQLLFASEGEALAYSPLDEEFTTLESGPLPPYLYNGLYEDSTLLIATYTPRLYRYDLQRGTLTLRDSMQLAWLPNSLAMQNGTLYLTHFKKNRITSIFDPNSVTNRDRFALWAIGWRIFKDYPIFGVGDIGVEILFPEYMGRFDKQVHGHLHNNYIHFLVILGLFGFIAAMWLLGKVVHINISLYLKNRGRPWVSSIALAGAGVCASFLVAGLTEWNFGDHEIITMLWFATGMSLGFHHAAKDGGESSD